MKEKNELPSIATSVLKLMSAISDLTERVTKFGFQLQHMDTLVSKVHSHMGLVENQLAFNKEAIASLAKIYAQQKTEEPAVTLTLPLSQATKLLQDPTGYPISAYLGEGLIDKDTAVLLKDPKDSSVLSAQEKHAALTSYSPENLNGGKITAIKMMRARTGLGLKEAKDKIEEWLAAHAQSAAA